MHGPAEITRNGALVVAGPLSTAEHQRHNSVGRVEQAHAPLSGAKTLGTDAEIVLSGRRIAVRVGDRFVVAAVQRGGRGRRPRRQGGRVRNFGKVGIASAGEGYAAFPGAAAVGGG